MNISISSLPSCKGRIGLLAAVGVIIFSASAFGMSEITIPDDSLGLFDFSPAFQPILQKLEIPTLPQIRYEHNFNTDDGPIFILPSLGMPETYHTDDGLDIFGLPPDMSPGFHDPNIPALQQADYDDYLSAFDTPIPEPGTIVLLFSGAALLGYRRWRKKRHDLSEHAVVMMKVPLPDHKTQQERLAQVGRKTDEVVHDIKNALTGMRTCVEVMAYDDLELDERKELAGLMVADIDRLVVIAEELLDFSHGKSQTLRLHPYSVKEAIRQLLTHLESSAFRQKVQIHTDLQYSGDVHVDSGKIQRVLLNLAVNALDAMPDGGTLTLRSSVTQTGLHIDIIDTGCGMSPEIRSHMFEPFFSEGKPHGNGLGMVIVKDIIEAHHGRIDVWSEVGEGTTVRISLPL